MTKRSILASLLAVVLLAGACAGTAAAPAPVSSGTANLSLASGTKMSEGGQVTVAAIWKGPADGASFDIKMDTHAVDLDALDLASAILRNDRGETLVARPWAAAKGGHHREGTLTFGGDSASFFARAKWIELLITGVGAVPERTLRWEIGS
jgi:hypothetical protein